jgi:hypothetical protein
MTLKAFVGSALAKRTENAFHPATNTQRLFPTPIYLAKLLLYQTPLIGYSSTCFWQQSFVELNMTQLSIHAKQISFSTSVKKKGRSYTTRNILQGDAAL